MCAAAAGRRFLRGVLTPKPGFGPEEVRCARFAHATDRSGGKFQLRGRDFAPPVLRGHGRHLLPAAHTPPAAATTGPARAGGGPRRGGRSHHDERYLRHHSGGRRRVHHARSGAGGRHEVSQGRRGSQARLQRGRVRGPGRRGPRGGRRAVVSQPARQRAQAAARAPRPDEEVSLVTLEEIQQEPAISTFIASADRVMEGLGYTEHGYRHANLTSRIAYNVMAGWGTRGGWPSWRRSPGTSTTWETWWPERITPRSGRSWSMTCSRIGCTTGTWPWSCPPWAITRRRVGRRSAPSRQRSSSPTSRTCTEAGSGSRPRSISTSTTGSTMPPNSRFSG